MNNLDLYRGLLATVIQSRIQMDAASAPADLLLNIFFIDVKNPGPVDKFAERTISRLELDLLDGRDAPEHLRDTTADTARAIWGYNANPRGAGWQRLPPRHRPVH